MSDQSTQKQPQTTRQCQEEEEDVTTNKQTTDNNSYSYYPRVKYRIETETTELQNETEEECSPFFVNLQKLPPSQIRHLRQVGLLPPEEVEEKEKEKCLTREVEKEGGDSVLKTQQVPSKAAKVLGVNDNKNQNDVYHDHVDDNNNDDDDYDDDDNSDDIIILEEHMDIGDTNNKQQSNIKSTSYDIRLLRSKHVQYLTGALTRNLSPSFASLDASKPWIIYWVLHSLDLLDSLPSNHVLRNIVSTLEKCWLSVDITFTKKQVVTDEILCYHVGNHEKKKEEGTLGEEEKDDEDEGKNDVGEETIILKGGGFGGGPGQMAHCATTYAAVLALCIIAGCHCDGIIHEAGDTERKKEDFDGEDIDPSEMALDLLQRKREGLYVWFLSLRHDMSPLDRTVIQDGPTMTGYRMHHDGETDVRAAYTILCCATLLDTITDQLTANVSRYVAACQTFEGGFGGEPHSEAHGGYTYCAVAALKLLNSMEHVNIADLRGWLVRRQMGYEGGFAGRCNKLVDGCYSFWQGGALAVLCVWDDKKLKGEIPHPFDSGIYGAEDLTRPFAGADTADDSNGSGGEDSSSVEGGLLFDQIRLQRYIMLCAQDVNGGLRDKPSKPRDFYHSCYNLSGLSASEHVLSGPHPVVYGDRSTNIVAAAHPCFNVRVEKVKFVLDHFRSMR